MVDFESEFLNTLLVLLLVFGFKNPKTLSHLSIMRIVKSVPKVPICLIFNIFLLYVRVAYTHTPPSLLLLLLLLVHLWNSAEKKFQNSWTNAYKYPLSDSQILLFLTPNSLKLSQNWSCSLWVCLQWKKIKISGRFLVSLPPWQLKCNWISCLFCSGNWFLIFTIQQSPSWNQCANKCRFLNQWTKS